MVKVPVNKEYLREQLTFVFGFCPLTDEFIDEVDSTSFDGFFTVADCLMYMHGVLNIPYTEEYQKIVDEERRKWGVQTQGEV